MYLDFKNIARESRKFDKQTSALVFVSLLDLEVSNEIFPVF